jgi:hypothetical protein
VHRERIFRKSLIVWSYRPGKRDGALDGPRESALYTWNTIYTVQRADPWHGCAGRFHCGRCGRAAITVWSLTVTYVLFHAYVVVVTQREFLFLSCAHLFGFEPSSIGHGRYQIKRNITITLASRGPWEEGRRRDQTFGAGATRSSATDLSAKLNAQLSCNVNIVIAMGVTRAQIWGVLLLIEPLFN